MGITRPRPDGGVTRKAPEALDPTVVLPPPSGGVKYVTVTQDESPWLCSERHDEYFFGPASENRRSGASDHQKKKHGKKGITRPSCVLAEGWTQLDWVLSRLLIN